MGRISAYNRAHPEAAGWTACAAMGLFALCHGRPSPVGLLAAGALALTGACALAAVMRADDGLAAWAGRPPATHPAGWIALAAAIGTGVASAYRIHLGASPWPGPLGRFAVPAALIGASEEFLYRGIVQTSLRPGGPWSAAAFTAAAHTAYKCLLFVARPAAEPQADLAFLAAATFLVGILLGWLREQSGSTWPPAAAHALFDILVYGPLPHAPWWVWR